MAERNIDALQPGAVNFAPRFDNAIVNVTTRDDISAASIRVTGPDNLVDKMESGMKNGEWTVSGPSGSEGVFMSSTGNHSSGVVVGGNVVGSNISVDSASSVHIYGGNFIGVTHVSGGDVTMNGQSVTAFAGDMVATQPLTVDAILPTGSSVRSELGAGETTISGDYHSISASSSSGSIDARAANANSMRIDSQSGMVRVEAVPTGGAVSTQAGDLRTGNVATQARVESQTGRVFVADVAENASVSSKTGRVSALDVDTRARVTSKTGDVSAYKVAPGAEVSSKTGRVSIKERAAPTSTPASGPRAETQGNVTDSVRGKTTHSSTHAPRTSAPRQTDPHIRRGGFGIPGGPRQ